MWIPRISSDCGKRGFRFGNWGCETLLAVWFIIFGKGKNNNGHKSEVEEDQGGKKGTSKTPRTRCSNISSRRFFLSFSNSWFSFCMYVEFVTLLLAHELLQWEFGRRVLGRGTNWMIFLDMQWRSSASHFLVLAMIYISSTQFWMSIAILSVFFRPILSFSGGYFGHVFFTGYWLMQAVIWLFSFSVRLFCLFVFLL